MDTRQSPNLVILLMRDLEYQRARVTRQSPNLAILFTYDLEYPLARATLISNLVII
jgi:hypothetical protein